MAILFDWYELPEPKDKQREEKILHPRIRLNGSTTTDELRRRIQERSINRKTFRDSFSNHFVSVLHLLTQNKL